MLTWFFLNMILEFIEGRLQFVSTLKVNSTEREGVYKKPYFYIPIRVTHRLYSRPKLNSWVWRNLLESIQISHRLKIEYD